MQLSNDITDDNVFDRRWCLSWLFHVETSWIIVTLLSCLSSTWPENLFFNLAGLVLFIMWLWQRNDLEWQHFSQFYSYLLACVKDIHWHCFDIYNQQTTSVSHQNIRLHWQWYNSIVHCDLAALLAVCCLSVESVL